MPPIQGYDSCLPPACPAPEEMSNPENRLSLAFKIVDDARPNTFAFETSALIKPIGLSRI